MNRLFSLWNSIQQYLIPHIEENIGSLSEKETLFVRVAELAAIDKHLGPYRWVGNGRKPHSRKALALAFIAKAVWKFPTTLALIEYLRVSPNLRRLCGWDSIGGIPSESTFSRAFDKFSTGRLPSLIHQAMVCNNLKGKLICHISKDSTAIEAREKPIKKQKGKQPKFRRGRPKKGEMRPEKQKKRLDLQAGRSLEENLSDLPSHCDIGVKRSSKGGKAIWAGYKLHLGVSDGDIPISAILTSASVHDSQVAIPLMQMSSERVTNLYDLADSAYDAPQIEAYSRSLGHVPIIDTNKRRGEAIPMEPAKALRFRERSSAERVNSNLKDNYGGRFNRVRGAAKVMAHLMFGIIALTANQLFNLLGTLAKPHPQLE
jgi:hypothetical protein